jgi:hypothetical protein
MTESGLRRSAGPTLDGVLGAPLDDLNLSAPPVGQVQIVGDAPLVSALLGQADRSSGRLPRPVVCAMIRAACPVRPITRRNTDVLTPTATAWHSSAPTDTDPQSGWGGADQ